MIPSNKNLNIDKIVDKNIDYCTDNNHVQQNIIKTQIKYNNKENVILSRKKELINHLSDNKLEYVENGICDSFVKFGKPPLKTVIETVQKNTNLQTMRLIKLMKQLKKENELYDDNISYYNDYIKNGGDIGYYVTEGIKEWFFKNKTNYLLYLKKYKDVDRAQTDAFNDYIKNNGPDQYTDRIKKTDILANIFH